MIFTLNDIQRQILKLKEEKKALILSHFYQPLEIQAVADHVCDSFDMAQRAGAAEEELIVICGVYFMAESAKILNPDKTVLIPRPDAGCPMADMIEAEDVRRLREQYPEAAVVCYVNSSATVKAVSDVCCTSSSAVRIVKALPNKQIIFIPDRNLGAYIAAQVPEKEVILYEEGCCPIHDSSSEAQALEARDKHPGAKLLAHPECPPEVLNQADFIGSTSQILEAVAQMPDREFIIATERGVIDRIALLNPDKKLYPLSEDFICPDMKKIGLDDLLRCLEEGVHQIELEEELIKAARSSLDRMINS